MTQPWKGVSYLLNQVFLKVKCLVVQNFFV
nr:MAG TPA: hypothetical protein [Caudoviricetes sp.]